MQELEAERARQSIYKARAEYFGLSLRLRDSTRCAPIPEPNDVLLHCGLSSSGSLSRSQLLKLAKLARAAVVAIAPASQRTLDPRFGA